MNGIVGMCPFVVDLEYRSRAVLASRGVTAVRLDRAGTAAGMLAESGVAHSEKLLLGRCVLRPGTIRGSITPFLVSRPVIESKLKAIVRYRRTFTDEVGA